MFLISWEIRIGKSGALVGVVVAKWKMSACFVSSLVDKSPRGIVNEITWMVAFGSCLAIEEAKRTDRRAILMCRMPVNRTTVSETKNGQGRDEQKNVPYSPTLTSTPAGSR